jgi:hypothetical protein
METLLAIGAGIAVWVITTLPKNIQNLYRISKSHTISAYVFRSEEHEYVFFDLRKHKKVREELTHEDVTRTRRLDGYVFCFDGDLVKELESITFFKDEPERCRNIIRSLYKFDETPYMVAMKMRTPYEGPIQAKVPNLVTGDIDGVSNYKEYSVKCIELNNANAKKFYSILCP